MLRFGRLITSNQEDHPSIEIEEVFPLPIFTKISTKRKFSKWAAYIDKYLVFPKKLKRVLRTSRKHVNLIHILDHSNAIYLPKLKRVTQAKKIMTCHDLIAIRSAKGDFAQSPQTSKLGKCLQDWISGSLHHADYYACDSRQTREDLNQLLPLSKERSSILHLGTEGDSLTNSDKKALSKALPIDPHNTNFLLHVGSAAWYKNRKAVFRSFVHANTSLPDLNLKLILVGPQPQKEELDNDLKDWVTSNPCAIHTLQNLPENTLSELYKYAQALVFPSFIEGFGWPPLEAAVRGCPVITTPTGAIEDLLGNYPIYVESENQTSINQGVMKAFQLGRSNQSAITLPSHEDCRRQYFDLYEQMIAN